MSTKYSRSGGKFNGNHTTLSPAACLVADIAHNCPVVTKISPGFLRAGLKSVNGQRRVKLTRQDSCILLAIRDNASHQEVHVYADNLQVAMLTIAKGARDAGLHIAFGKQ